MKRTFGSLIAIAALITLVDRLTKAWIIQHFYLGQSREILSFFYLTLVKNTGTAFGMLQGNNHSLLLLSLVILGVLLYAARGLTERAGLWGFLGVALILGGAIGNLIDRWHYGQVIDFLDFRVWPVFNVADSAISVGTFLMMIGLFKAGQGNEAKGNGKE